jgi:signal transduction histidine kinase
MPRALAWRLTPVTADRLIAAGLAAWALFDVPWWWRPPGHSGSNLAIAGLVALAIAQSAPFLWRRQQPAIVLGVTAAALAVKFAAHLNLWSASAAVLTAAYGLGAYGGRGLRRAARVLAAAAVLAAIVSLQVTGGEHATAVACALFAAALALGEITASHRDLVTSVARQADDQRRASLAREVHDVVAHQLSAIAVQAGAARLAADDDPRAAVTAVTSIEQAARAGLAELNTLVRQLRQAGPAGQQGAGRPGTGEHCAGPAGAGGRADAKPGPQPRLDEVPGLVERARQAGLRAELRVDGEARLLADAVELAGYRVVQEGLTNAVRYAPGAAATVRLRYSGTGITIEVADEGRAGLDGGSIPAGEGGGAGEGDGAREAGGTGAAGVAHQGASAGPGGGAGLAGLRERAALLGGQFEAGSGQQGFVIRAFLPSPA